MNVNHYCEALNSIQDAFDGKKISHANYLQAIAEIGHAYYLQDDAVCLQGESPRIVFSEHYPKPEPVELPKPIGYVSKHAAQDLANGHLCTITPDRMLDDGQDWELPVYLHAQAEQQEAPRTCSDERPCVNCFADNGDCRGPDPQEAKGAPAVDERAAFESTLAPSLSRETFVDEEGDTIYCDTWVQGASIGWRRRAALATQPAVRKYVTPVSIATFEKAITEESLAAGFNEPDLSRHEVDGCEVYAQHHIQAAYSGWKLALGLAPAQQAIDLLVEALVAPNTADLPGRIDRFLDSQPAAAHGDEAGGCRHRLADARNKHIVSGYFCVDCGAAFAAADHAAMRAQAGEFQREDRYIVIKRKDFYRLPMEMRLQFSMALRELAPRLPKREYLVVESDWPEYEPTWAAIQARVEARAALATQPAAGEPVAWIVVDEPFHGVQGIQSGEWDIELDAKAIESLAQDNSPGRIALFTAAPPAAAQGVELESIGEMCRMLEDGEFAEHAGKGPTADRVESCIVKLLGEISEANERADRAEKAVRANGVALLAEMDQYLDGFAGNAICAGSKLHERIKSVLLDPPAASTTSDQYRAELYDEVWAAAKGMGYANVTDALQALANRLTNERAGHKPAAAIDASGDVITERDCVSPEVFATCCKVATPLFYAFARGVPVYQIRQHGTDEWKTVGPNSYDAAANCPDLARRVAYLPLAQAYS